jgi:hypothetical protein
MYVGPDQVMPVMSVLATILGFLLVFWTKVVGIFRKIFGLGKRDENPAHAAGVAAPAKQDDSAK